MTNIELTDEMTISGDLFKKRMRLKKLSQLSYELKSIENGCPQDQYELENSKRLLYLYGLVEDKILEVAQDIKNNT